MTLYAGWKINGFLVTFDSNGGSSVEPQVVQPGNTAVRPAEPTKQGYYFKGWTYDDFEYYFDEPVTSDITLVGKWINRTNETAYSQKFYFQV